MSYLVRSPVPSRRSSSTPIREPTFIINRRITARSPARTGKPLWRFLLGAGDSAGMYKGFRNVFFGDGKCKILKVVPARHRHRLVDMTPFDAKHTSVQIQGVCFPGERHAEHHHAAERIPERRHQ